MARRIILIAVIAIGFFLGYFIIGPALEDALSREPTASPYISSKTIEPTPTPLPSLDRRRLHLEGWASWYGTGQNECLGCSPARIMANGERMDDARKTIACGIGGSCRHLKLGDRVVVLNLDNMMLTEAVVTDRGGFAGLGRIIDMTKAVRDAINCSGLCRVRVTKLN